MAGIIKTVSTYKDEITCSMCLQIFTYPVSLRCSHSFCLRCIQDHLKHKLASDKYSCPECHSVFEEKPRLLKNTDLSDKVEQLSKYQESRIFCDYCLEDDVPAVMGCVQCEAFFCVTHLRPHSEKVYLKEHVLLEPTEVISLHKCMEHKEVLKLYCKEDRVCVALLEKLKELNAKKMKTEKEVKHLREMNSQILYFYIIYFRICSLLNKEELHVHETVVDEGKLSSLIKVISKQSNSLVKQASSIKKALLSYATTVTLDPVTANENLILSEDRTIVRYTDEIQKAPYSPKRFDDTLYVLGSEGFTFGRHYWEVVVKNKTDWEIGAAYPSLPRKGQCWLGRNNVSWSLECSSGQCIAWRNNVPAKINIKSKLERVGVYLDYTGGMIAFYDADNMSLLMSFYNKFTEAVYPVLNPCNNKGGNYAPLTIMQLKGVGLM
ncbi:zinc-binding protein A33-like [Latimeria chalumnae]|uniref:zinc-binding protein A33-like n=1 Tax=Latimeria chalumnae TaxID=7897 RepID=UPI00313E53C9